MNSLFAELGIGSWKPFLTLLMLPPVPLLLLVVLGTGLLPRRRVVGLAAIGIGAIGIWLGGCTGAARALSAHLLHPPPALGAQRIAELAAQVRAGTPPVAIVVLGGGMESAAPEYGTSSLNWLSLERLRYGVWLSRRVGAPLAFSGGRGWGEPNPRADAEATVAARIAATDFARPLTWIEDRSRDTTENANFTVPMLKAAGIRHIVLVTHGFHMPRSRRAFERAAGTEIRIEVAPMGLARHVDGPVVSWMPTERGFVDVRYVLHEVLGLWFGA